MLDRKEINKTLGNASLLLRIQNIATRIAQGKPPSALQIISLCRSLLHRYPRIAKAFNKAKVAIFNTLGMTKEDK